MGRSVMVPGDAIATVYVHVEIEDPLAWDDFVDNLRDEISARYPTMKTVKRWAGRETAVILESEWGCVAVCEYCGLVSINLVPKPGNRRAFKVRDAWHRFVSKRWGGMTSLGFASNGEQFFVRN